MSDEDRIKRFAPSAFVQIARSMQSIEWFKEQASLWFTRNPPLSAAYSEMAASIARSAADMAQSYRADAHVVDDLREQAAWHQHTANAARDRAGIKA